MRWIVLLILLASVATVNAQTPAATGRPDDNPPANGGGPDSSNYQYDDGTVEDAIGITQAPQGYDIIWLNRFTRKPNVPAILAVHAAIGSPGNNANLNGRPMSVLVYTDPDGGSPSNATVFARRDTTVTNANTGVVNNYSFFPFLEIPPGTFFVGILMKNLPPSGAAGDPRNTFPAAIDTTAPHTPGVSWAGFTAPGNSMNENNLGTIPAGQLGVIEGFGINGNWVVRASGIPEPTCLGLLALAGVLGRRPRRRQSARLHYSRQVV